MPADPPAAPGEHGASAPGLDAQNYFSVLSVIDRTILPRRLLFHNGAATLVLRAARQQASLADAASGNALEDLAAAIAGLCGAGAPVVHRSEPLNPDAVSGHGFSAAAIANARARPAEANGGRAAHYRFTQSGLPVGAPPLASFASITAAARIAWSISAWRESHVGELDSPMLILAISEALTEDLSVSVGGGVTITSTPPALLGRLVASWRSHEGNAALPAEASGDEAEAPDAEAG